MGTETLKYLKDAGANRITIVNRSRGKSEQLAKEFESSIADWSDLHSLIVEADLVVSTTAAKESIVTVDQFKQARGKSRNAVLVLDLAVPRDFDPAISELTEVYLFSIDDLQQVCDRNLRARQEQWPKAQQIVEKETTKFLAELKHQGSGNTIKQLREQANSIKQSEFDRLMTKLQSKDLDSSDQEGIGSGLRSSRQQTPSSSNAIIARACGELSTRDTLRRVTATFPIKGMRKSLPHA